MQIRKSIVDTLLIMLTLLAIFEVFTAAGVARTVFAGLLLFALPGGSILAAWFPHRLARPPDNILLTITLSMAAAAIGGLLLNILPVGLLPQTWVLWLGGVTILNAGIAFLRDLRGGSSFAFGSGWGFHPGQVLLLMMAGVLVVGAVVIARTGALDQQRPGFTQLWMLQTPATRDVQLGIQNDEGTSTSYWLIVQHDGVTIQSYTVELPSAQKWEMSLQLPPGADSSSAPYQALLYRADDPETVYRSASLWLANVDSR